MKRESMGELETILTHSSDALLISDPSGKILYVNPAIEKISGLDVKTHQGKNIRDLLRDRLINHSATLESLEQRKTVTREVKTIAGKRLLNTASPVLDSSGRLERVVCNIRSLKVYPSGSEDTDNLQPYEPYSLEPGFPYRLVSIDDGEYEIVANSKEMESLVELAVHVAQVDSTAIIYGETGVGKELIARLIHSKSSRNSGGSFVKVNCASFPPSLIESELFGYDPGSFTGALKTGKAGFFELADKGTLFLDEIAELPLEVQAKLLGVLQDREIIRIGGTRPRALDIRIIAATNQNLQEMVHAGSFRKDLFYRLQVVPLDVPPLRERAKDIPALIQYCSAKLKERYGMHKEINPALMEHLTRYSWPGNVRELFNLVERLLITVPQQTITPAHLSETYADESKMQSNFVVNDNVGPLKEMVSEFELAVVKRALEQCSSHQEAAEMLGISLSSFTRRIRKIKQSSDNGEAPTA